MVPIYQASLVQMCWQKKLGQNATEMLKNNINIFWLFPYLERKTTSFHRERGKMLAILKGQIMNSLNNQSKTGLRKWLFLSEYETLVHFPLISQRNATYNMSLILLCKFATQSKNFVSTIGIDCIIIDVTGCREEEEVVIR